MTLILLSSCVLLSLLIAFYTLYRRVTYSLIAQIPGPEPESFLLGTRNTFPLSCIGLTCYIQAIYASYFKVKPLRSTLHVLLFDMILLLMLCPPGRFQMAGTVRPRHQAEGPFWCMLSVHTLVGSVIIIMFQENRLLLSDPKALQYIYQTSGYNFVKQPERREVSRILSGRGILWADGLYDDC